MATRVGNVVDNKYEILKQIGKGGMSTVYLAMDKRLNKQWAVKEIRRTASGKNDEVIINSLLAEANLMKRLDHPALPRIVDIIEDSKTIYVVMDYIEGESLDKILQTYGPQPQELVIEWAKQLCDALGYLHSQKPPIIYRDMKPANIMLKPEGNLKVIDFGIAREYKEASLADTTVLGTRGYAPPEQHGSRQTDARSDIYALGMTVHHLLTGVDPRPADYMYAPIRQWNPELSAGLERVIDKCTALDPEDRYQNCNELMYALTHYEEEDGAYKKKQRKKLHGFMAAVLFTIGMLLVGITGQVLKTSTNNSNYDELVNVSASTPYETRIDSYLKAIDIYGTDTRAYIKMLEAYSDNGTFGDEESGTFTNAYNDHQAQFNPEDSEYLELCYQAGLMYLYMYSGGDNTFRTRVLKATPYFQIIVESEQTDFAYYNMAQSYYLLGMFYSQYVVDSTSVKEPQLENYTELLESLQTCLGNVQQYDGDDAAYINLVMAREIINLLNDHRKGLAKTGVTIEAVQKIYDTVERTCSGLSVTQETSLGIQDEILQNLEIYRENLKRSYENQERSVTES